MIETARKDCQGNDERGARNDEVKSKSFSFSVQRSAFIVSSLPFVDKARGAWLISNDVSGGSDEIES
jgi:hypothetical protein